MKLNRDVLISGIIKHQKVFFQMLDYIDKHDGSLEIPEYLYINSYNNIVCLDPDDSIHHQLSIASLVENGVFVHNDKHNGMITIERVIIDLLRFLDVKRARELTHSDFEQMRLQIVNAVEYVMSQVIGSQSYIDAMATFNRLMSEIHSKVKENVQSLTTQVDYIALEYKTYSSGSTEISAFDLYNKVSVLHRRFVLPCYEFINPTMDMVCTQTFSKAVDALHGYHTSMEEAEFNSAIAIQLRKIAITSYYKNIELLTKKLQQFSNHLEKERNCFLAIEGAYSQLMDSIIPLRHGRKRNKYLTSESEVFNCHSVLDGLTNQRAKFASKLKWDSRKTKLRFKEYLATVEEKHIKPIKTELKPLPASKKVSQERQILISRILYSESLKDDISDLHQFILSLLKTHLADFQLSDVLYGIEAFLPKLEGVCRTQELTRKRVNDERYFLEYVQLEYKKRIESV